MTKIPYFELVKGIWKILDKKISVPAYTFVPEGTDFPHVKIGGSGQSLQDRTKTTSSEITYATIEVRTLEESWLHINSLVDEILLILETVPIVLESGFEIRMAQREGIDFSEEIHPDGIVQLASIRMVYRIV